MNKILLTLIGGIALALASPAIAQNGDNLSTLDILAAADAHRGDVFGATWTLDVKEEKGDQSQLAVQAANQNFLAEYKAPASQARQKLLEIGQNMWFVSPGASRPVPISRRQKLLGNASYGDIAGQRWSSDYEATGRFDAIENRQPAWIIELKAKTDKATYDAITLYILKEDIHAVRSEMRNADGEILKTATYEYNNKVPGRHEAAPGKRDTASFISSMVIEGKDAGKTTLAYRDVDFEPLSPQTFVLSNVMQNN